MIKNNLIIYLILLISFVFSQAPKGIHQIEWEKHQNDVKVLYKSESAQAIIPLDKNIAKAKGLTHAVFGYLPYWVHNDPPLYFQFDLLTHIALFDFSINSSTGAIGNPSGWPWNQIINEAHSNGVKVIMCVVEFDNDNIHKILTNSTVKNNFFVSVKSTMEAYNLDGVNIDFEGLHQNDRANNINPFMAALTDYVHTNIGSDKEVSLAGPAVNWSSWNLPGLAAACDYIFIMGYDFSGSWSATAGPSAPLSGANYNITRTLTNISDGWGRVVKNNPEKLILGVPYYGNKWRTASQSEGTNTLEHIGSRTYARAISELGSSDLLWSSKYKVPWYTYQSSGKFYQTWFDDDSSLKLKYDLVKSKNLKGIGMWALGYDKQHTELWDLLRCSFLDTSVAGEIPEDIKLYQNYPNPFNSGTTIEYDVSPAWVNSDVDQQVTLSVYNVISETVAILVDESQSPGKYSVKLKIKNYELPSGVYFFQLRVDDKIETKKMMYIK